MSMGKNVQRASINKNADPREILTDARIALVRDHPFLGYLTLKMSMFQANAQVPTTAVNAKGQLFYNEDFVRTLDRSAAKFVAGHEVMHLVQRCHSRFPVGGNHTIWNLAADQIINTMLVDMGLQLPDILKPMMTEALMKKIRGTNPGGENDEASTYMTTEERYYQLLKEMKDNECPACKAGIKLPNVDEDENEQNGGEGEQSGDGEGEGEDEGEGGSSPGQGKGGKNKKDHQHGPNGEPCEHDGDDGSGETPQHTCKNICHSACSVDVSEADAQSLHDWEQNVINAAEQARGKGNLPGFARDFISSLTKPTVTWKDHIRAMAVSAFRGRYTFQRANRRESAIKARLPGRKPQQRGAVITIDTSGSITDEEIRQFLSECAGIMDQCGCPELYIFFHDVECYHHEKYTKGSLTKIKVSRGGTSHVPVFAKIDEVFTHKKPAMVVCFTDLATAFPNRPTYPVVWAYPPGYGDGANVPWGKKVAVKLADKRR